MHNIGVEDASFDGDGNLIQITGGGAQHHGWYMVVLPSPPTSTIQYINADLTS
jgi:hypothetical protein